MIDLKQATIGKAVVLDGITFRVSHLYRGWAGAEPYAIGLEGGGYLYPTDVGWFIKEPGLRSRSVKTVAWA
jgi:hypothetical protein